MNIIINPKYNKTQTTFPQSNNIYLLIKFLDKLTYNKNKEKLNFVDDDITERQVSYYLSALEYLGLIDNKKPTKKGYYIMSFDFKLILVSFVKIILDDKLFYNYYEKKNIDKCIKHLLENYSLSISTANRRASTIKQWVKWCEIVIQENNIELEVL